jgi:AmmeMemoRadiSam system protein B/AmmeMemoRadiSam system protein A
MAGAATVAGGVRPAAVAGLFYPADPAELRSEIARFLDAAAALDAAEPGGVAEAGGAGGAAAPVDEAGTGSGEGTPSSDPGPEAGSGSADGPAPGEPAVPAVAPDPPKAVIAPHAGYRYSGLTAGYAYHALAPRRGEVERVVVVGPAHRVRVGGVGLSTARAWATPFGPMEVDVTACCALEELPGVVVADDAHAPEHSIEVHLPFVHEVFGEVTVVPLVVGRATITTVAKVLDAVWGGDETAIVVSSDLSHYLDEAAARRRDRRTATAVLEGRAADIGPHDACGCLPIGGLLAAAVGHGLAPQLLDLRTSADTAGEPSRVVGYGSFALRAPHELSDDDRAWLLDLAKRAIAHELEHGKADPLDDDDVPFALRRPGATFVTLERGTELLGCIGSLDPRRPLWRDVARNARGAAFDDPRFPPLAPGELAGVSVEVSVLTALRPLPSPSLEAVAASLRPGVDGLVLSAGGRRATFLPDVWDKIPEPEAFVRELVRKARWSEPWVAGAKAWRYTTTSFSSEA